MNELQTPDGAQAWEILKACAGQMRVGFNGPYALDFGACITFADRMGGDSDLFIELLPVLEQQIIRSYRKEP